jgi:uncharacterized protein YndB with AHSA1/START domain
MLVRQVVIPVSPSELWDALTEPEVIATWFGSQVEWDLRPGGRARFLTDEGTVRGGVVDDVRPGRHLSFRWWPEGEDQSAASQVSYDLEPEDDGTVLTVTEQPLGNGANEATEVNQSTQACAWTASAADPMGSWTGWDTRLFRCWAARIPATAPALVGGRAVR